MTQGSFITSIAGVVSSLLHSFGLQKYPSPPICSVDEAGKVLDHQPGGSPAVQDIQLLSGRELPGRGEPDRWALYAPGSLPLQDHHPRELKKAARSGRPPSDKLSTDKYTGLQLFLLD